jgi:SRSO17 transposase
MQSLLSCGAWDHDGVRDDVRDMVVEHLGGGGMLVLDETGDVKKGVHTVGVQRQGLVAVAGGLTSASSG